MFEQKVKREGTLLLTLGYKFFAYRLGITDEQLKMVSIDICTKIKGAEGRCMASFAPTGEVIKIRVQVLKSASDIGMLDILAHEMVHVAQYLRGEHIMSYRWEPIFKWIPFIKWITSIVTHAGQILEDTPYYEMICEQEAFNKSRELTRQFLNFINVLENMALLKNQTDSINKQNLEVLCF
jgi:hypothetical protein